MGKAQLYYKYTHVMCDETKSKSKRVNKLNIVAWSVIEKDCFVVYITS